MATLIGTQLKNVLPAYAGMIRRRMPPSERRLRAPRVCGDDPICCNDMPLDGSCSPRMRG